MKVSDRLVVKCTDITNQGMGVTHVDRFPFFVSNLLPDEEAEIEIVQLRSKFGIGKVINRLTDSPERVTPICPYFDICGGCQIMHLKDQNEFKFDQTKKIMNQVIEPLVPSPQQYGYRNKIIFKAEPNKVGLYQLRSNEIVDIDYCYLISELKNNILHYIRQNYKDLTEVTIRGDEEIMVNLNGNNIDPEPLFNHFKEIKSVYTNNEFKLGLPYIIKQINDIKFKLSLESFFQVNTLQTEFLYNKIIELANFTGNETVLDLYCGVGSIGLSVSKHVKNVIGVEINQQAIIDAHINKELNNIENIQFYCDDTTNFLNNYHDKIDVVIVDPPRKGLTPQGIEDILKLNPDKIIYVSCNPITLKRDLDILNKEYKIKEITPFDMFPHTYHVETLVLLSKVAPTK